MMRDHKPISIADQVFEKLERDILSGKYPQGEILSELRLSGELGVSRTPIREAIRRLEQERILEDSGHGLVVIGISRQDMLDIYEIRLQLEGLAAKRAAASITDDVLSEMKEVLDLQRFYIESEKEPGENSDQVKNLDSRFQNTQEIDPMPVIIGAAQYPENLIEKMEALGIKVDAMDCLSLAEEAGSSKAVNIVLMGRLSKYFDIPVEKWQKAIEECVPAKFVELNHKAFALGRGEE